MKEAPETGPKRSGTRYSAADKLKAVEPAAGKRGMEPS